MAKLIGYKRADFTTKEGQTITGCNVYLSNEVDPRVGAGVSADRLYLSDAKMERENINLKNLVGKNVRAYFNRYGKLDSLVVSD